MLEVVGGCWRMLFEVGGGRRGEVGGGWRMLEVVGGGWRILLADVYLVDLESLSFCVWCQLGKLLPGMVCFVVCVFRFRGAFLRTKNEPKKWPKKCSNKVGSYVPYVF